MSISFTIAIQKEENWFVAKCIENNVASQGKTMDEAIINLREAIALYREWIPVCQTARKPQEV